jgi:hypothetical protein
MEIASSSADIFMVIQGEFQNIKQDIFPFDSALPFGHCPLGDRRCLLWSGFAIIFISLPKTTLVVGTHYSLTPHVHLTPL